VSRWFSGGSINFTDFFACELGAIDSNGHNRRDRGNDGIRVGWGLEVSSWVEDVARGEEINDVERESNGEW